MKLRHRNKYRRCEKTREKYDRELYTYLYVYNPIK